MRRRAWWWIAAAVVVGLVATGCSDEGDDLGEPVEAEVGTEDEGSDAEDSAAASGEVECSPEALGALEGYDFISADLVEGGELGDTCLGEPDETLAAAWDVLASIVPADDLADLGIFAGFDSSEGGEEVTLAFVNRLEGDPDQFQMSINLAEAEADPDELTLTMVHEFGHVLTQLPDQLDLDVAPADCDTFYNGDGCFVPGSIMDEWIQAFWTPDQLAEVDPFEPSAADGEERCTLDEGFFGSYAASSPEEDFAEALSAFVLGVPAETDGQQERYDLLDQYPDIAEQQLNAEDAGLAPLPNTFEPCG